MTIAQWLGQGLCNSTAAFAIVLSLVCAPGALAQANTIDPEQEVDHFKPFGQWEVMCDLKKSTGEKRCYVRLVDVYSPRPDFKAAFVFITATRGNDGKPVLKFDFSLERGFTWSPQPMSIAHADGRKTGLPMVQCGRPACPVEGADANGLASSLAANSRRGADLVLSFRERDGRARELTWAIDAFDQALADFAVARSTRGLP